VGCEVGGHARNAVLLEIAWCAADDHAAWGEVARDKARVRKELDAHGNIETFVDQVDNALAQHQFDRDCGKARGEVGDGGRQLQYAEARRGIDAQLPARGRVHVAHRLLGCLEIDQ
jgi:hypothetical protein